MKKLLLILLTTVMAACGGIKQTASGLENVGFLQVFGDPQKYPGGVLVTLDKAAPVVAEVISPGRAARKVELPSVKIPYGKHALSVTYQGRVVFERQIFLSSQETYKVELP